MHRFKNILLLHEWDEPTFERAVALAKDNEACLTTLQVVRELPDPWREVDLGGSPVDLQELAVREYRARLAEVTEPLRAAGIEVAAKVVVGTPFLEIIREVSAHQRDLVIMTAEGVGGLKERLFGSTSLHLMRKCPCPVWVMKPSHGARFERILAAIDPDPADPNRDSLNGTILQLASSLAAQDEAELHVVHAWTLTYENLMRGRGGFSESDVRAYAETKKVAHREALDRLITAHSESASLVHLIKGEAEQVIPEITRKQHVDLLVMGTVCRTGIPGFFIGNTAEKILDDVDCSVLTVKPEGFVSPVAPA